MPKNILLFNSPITLGKKDALEMGNLYPRIGIASIAAYLLEKGIEVSVIDPNALNLKEVKNKISKLNPDIVGIPSYTEEIHDAAYTAKIAKEVNPEIITVVGGPHASAIPVETLQEFSDFDIAVVGEGELTFHQIATTNNLENTEGIAFREENGIKLNPNRPLIPDLDVLPLPAWHLYDLDNYRGGSLIYGFGKKGKTLELPVESARGCPFNCIFCYRVCGKSIRFKSPEKVADEVERDVYEFGANKIHFVEGTFGVNKELAMEMCKELIKRGLHKKITWSSGGRVNVLDKELLSIMKKAGCVYLGFGAESGDNEILKTIKKGITTDQMEKVFKLCQEIGIKTEANFILGHPYETEETILKTIAYAKKLKADHATFAILVPFPGTEVREMAEKGIGGLKILNKDWRLYGKQIGGTLELDQLPLEKLIKLQTRAYREFYFRPNKIFGFVGRLSLKRVVYGVKRMIIM